MSNPFLNYGNDTITIESLSNGTGNININSAQIQGLSANLPVVTDGNKILTSSLILQNQVFNLVDDLADKVNNPMTSALDCGGNNITNCPNIINNPHTGNISASGDFIANYNTTPISLITTSTTANNSLSIANTAQTTANNAQTTANNALPRSGGTMTGSINMGTNSISNINNITTTTANIGSGTGYLTTTSGAVNSVTTIPSTAISGVTFPASGLIVGTTDNQTLTNKTMSGSNNTFSNIPSTSINGVTFPASGLIVGTTDNQTLTNKTMSGSSNTFSNIPSSAINNTSFLNLSGGTMTGSINMGTNSISNVNNITTTTANIGSGTGYLTSTAGLVGSVASIPSTAISGVTFPASGLIVGTTDNQTLTNKTMSGSNNTFSNIPSSAINNTSFLSLSGGTMTGNIDMQTNAIVSTGTISGQTLSATGSVNANGLNMGSTAGTISGSGGVTIQPAGGQSINLSTLGAGVINLNTSGTAINANTTINMQNNGLINVGSIAGGVSGLVSIAPVLAVGNLRFNTIPNRISSLNNLVLTPATNSNLSFAASGTGNILYTVDTGAFHQFAGNESHTGNVLFSRSLTVATNGNTLILDTGNVSVPISIQSGGGEITCGGIITAPQYTCNFDHSLSTNSYTSGVARFITSAAAPTINNNFGFTIGANGSITPNWTGSRRCRVTGMLGNGYSAGPNDLNFQLWLQLSGTATNPAVGVGISYGLTRNTSNTRFGQTYTNILSLVGGSSYQFAGSVNGTITYSQTLSVSIESLLS